MSPGDRCNRSSVRQNQAYLERTKCLSMYLPDARLEFLVYPPLNGRGSSDTDLIAVIRKALHIDSSPERPIQSRATRAPRVIADFAGW
jgi:hypothetical protein